MRISSKPQFFEHCNTGIIENPKDSFKVYIMPSGALCTVELVCGVPNLVNGTMRFVNDSISRALVEAGVVGDVLIRHPTFSRNSSKWISTAVLSNPENDHTWKKILRFYHFSPRENIPTDLLIEPVPSTHLFAGELRKYIDIHSEMLDFDGIIVEAKTVRGLAHYRMLPNRYIIGTILAVRESKSGGSIDSIVVELEYEGKKYPTLVTRLPSWMKQREYFRNRAELLGRHAKVQYTTFLRGDRLKNFSSPIVLAVN